MAGNTERAMRTCPHSSNEMVFQVASRNEKMILNNRHISLVVHDTGNSIAALKQRDLRKRVPGQSLPVSVWRRRRGRFINTEKVFRLIRRITIPVHTFGDFRSRKKTESVAPPQGVNMNASPINHFVNHFDIMNMEVAKQ